MKHGTIVIPNERARQFVDVLGRRTNIQFIDMNAHSMRRPYKRQMQRVDELERILRFLYDEIGKLGAKVESGHIENFLANDETYQLDRVEMQLKKLYEQFTKFRDNNTELVEARNAAIEEKYVAMAASQSHGGEGGDLGPGLGRGARVTTDERDTHGLLDAGGNAGDRFAALGGTVEDTMSFSTIAGVILKTDQERFARTLFRASRGNTFTHFTAISEGIQDPKSGKAVEKAVFVVYFQGGSGSAMGEKIQKICNAFSVNVYPWPASFAEAERRTIALGSTIEDKQRALEAYEKYFVGEIDGLLLVTRPGGNSVLEEWRLFTAKEKAIVATLNLFEGEDLALRASCWYPTVEEETIRRVLEEKSNEFHCSAFLLADRSGSSKKPPTYIRRNEFTWPFQELVDTYGVPRYQEVNPALFTCVTFPFLFGIMYGDIGHGTYVLLFGIWLVMAANKLSQGGGLMAGFVQARFMILLMGVFAVYAGFMYNDFLSVGFNIFGSQWSVDHSTGDSASKGGVYPFGLDPAWKGATNELVFTNSFKMKFAVIVGVVQMALGVFCKGLNALHFRSGVDFIFEFIPQMVFLLATFGYMDFLIVFKWIAPYGVFSGPFPTEKVMIIKTMIQMFMDPFGKLEAELFPGQQTIQLWLLLAVLVSLPIMLLPKPFILLAQENAKRRQEDLHSHRQLDEEAGGPSPQTAGRQSPTADSHSGHEGGGHGHGGDDEEEEFQFGEVFIHQVIETIEFVLGCVSNTASYLRLWALSLAHAQLAVVFFQKTMVDFAFGNAGEGISGIIITSVMTFVMFAMFMGITFAVILCMDLLECFLHALRLQWVEFQNKFYKADGYPFKPFNHKAVLSASQGED